MKWGTAEYLVVLGFDAFRLAIGQKPKTFTPMQIVWHLEKLADVAQPLKLHPAVLAAHAEFGGDLEQMQRAYDKQEPLSERHAMDEAA